MTEGSFSASRQVLKINGHRIRQIREHKGLTQLYIASVVGVTTDTISRWENRKYPSIKRENALKLAEALEVSLDDILENEGSSPDTGPKSEHISPAPLPSKKKRLSHWQKAMIISITITVGLLFFLGKKSKMGTSSAIVTATRILPRYVAPDTKFPVIIKIHEIGAETSIIIKESIPKTCSLVGYHPHASALTSGRDTLQWILSLPKEGLDFIYVLHCNKKIKLGKRLKFSGTITSRGARHANIPLEGEQITIVGPFHWADRNADHIIDDQEVLEAFDTLDSIEGLESDLRHLEILWAEGPYEWDPIKLVFYPVKEAQNDR